MSLETRGLSLFYCVKLEYINITCLSFNTWLWCLLDWFAQRSFFAFVTTDMLPNLSVGEITGLISRIVET